jgi:hypothetical protein
MALPRSAELERKEKVNKQTGTRIVILGALASVILWLIVLGEGGPIKPFNGQSLSFVYAFVITLPVIVLSILAIARAGRGEKIRAH